MAANPVEDAGETKLATAHGAVNMALKLAALPALPQRLHINHKPVLHVAFEQALVSLVDLLNFDQFDIGGEAVIGAEIEHLLRFLNAADA